MAESRRPSAPARPPARPPGREEPRRIVTPPRPAPAAPGGVRVVSGSGFFDTSKGVFPGAGRELRAEPPPAMSARAFKQELARLLRTNGEEQGNPGSVSCQNCQRCESCMFCVDCEQCYRCTHSHGCRDSSHLTHCVDCVGSHDCAYCVQSENCTRSNYLVMSRNCSECSYCFGCVGLSKKDFHILNVKYTRSEYFRIVKSLQAELGLEG